MPMLLFKTFGLGVIGSHLAVDLVAIEVVISESSIYLSH